MRVASLFLILFGLLPVAALAADPAPEPPPDYRIELLLFLRDPAPAGENWPEDAGSPDPGRAVATVLGGPPPLVTPAATLPDRDGTPLPTTPASAIPAAPLAPAAPLVRPVPDSELQLNAHAEALRRKGLTPLLHVAWEQPVGGLDNPDWLWLDAGQISGLVRISLGRYLHIDTDLAMQSSAAPSGVIHSVDHRRMRSGKLHYLDHPGFGLLVIIEPVDKTSETTSGSDNADAPGDAAAQGDPPPR